MAAQEPILVTLQIFFGEEMLHMCVFVSRTLHIQHISADR